MFYECSYKCFYECSYKCSYNFSYRSSYECSRNCNQNNFGPKSLDSTKISKDFGRLWLVLVIPLLLVTGGKQSQLLVPRLKSRLLT